VYSVTTGGNLWIEANQEYSKSEDSSKIEADLALSVSYMGASGAKIFEGAARCRRKSSQKLNFRFFVFRRRSQGFVQQRREEKHF
jgi:hypothetical protein